MNMKFDGSDYDHERDCPRLSSQYLRIFELMKDGQPRTLLEIANVTQDPEASISAQIRHMRKPRFGAHVVIKNYVGNGLYTYKLIVNTNP